MTSRIGVLLASLCLLSGCTAWGPSDGRDHDPANQPGYVRPGDRTDTRQSAHRVRAGGAKGESATFQLVDGSDVVRVSVGDLGRDLVEISTPDGSRALPTVNVDGPTVTAGLRDSADTGPAVVTVVLSDDVRWDVRLAGGSTEETVDLTGAPAGGDVSFTKGTTRAVAILPAASGTRRVVMSGGAGQLVVLLAGPQPVRVAARGGAGSVTIDGTPFGGVGANSVWTATGWDTATDRYDIDAAAGVATLTVERTR